MGNIPGASDVLLTDNYCIINSGRNPYFSRNLKKLHHPVHIPNRNEVILRVRKDEFIHALCDELIRQGISEETARHYVHAIEESLSDSDLTEIEQMQDTGEIKKLARGIILFRQRSGSEERKSSSPSPADKVNGDNGAEGETVILNDDEDEEPGANEEVYDSDDDVKIFTGTFTPSPSTVPAEPDFSEEEYEEIIHDDDFLQ